MGLDPQCCAGRPVTYHDVLVDIKDLIINRLTILRYRHFRACWPGAPVLEPTPARQYLPSVLIDGAPHDPPGPIEHVRVDHCRFHIGVTEQSLDRPDIVTLF